MQDRAVRANHFLTCIDVIARRFLLTQDIILTGVS